MENERDKKSTQKNAFIIAIAKEITVSKCCEVCQLPRATYYRWLAEDDDFRNSVEIAKAQNIDRINDIAENSLVQKIEEGNMAAIKYWLEHNHKRFVKKQPSPRPYRLDGLEIFDPNSTW